jgi:hypothetical protein
MIDGANPMKRTPALTLLDFENGEWAVTLNDFVCDSGDVCTVTVFHSKEQAEAFIAEQRSMNLFE